jgi:hypothetical protein
MISGGKVESGGNNFEATLNPSSLPVAVQNLSQSEFVGERTFAAIDYKFFFGAAEICHKMVAPDSPKWIEMERKEETFSRLRANRLKL